MRSAMVVSLTQLRLIMPNLQRAKATAYLPELRAAFIEFGIASLLQNAAALAQMAHESGELRWWEEIGTGLQYEMRADLGNTRPGDGVKYKGRGPIQLTGRKNYILVGNALGVPLEAMPQLAAEPHVGFRVFGHYWRTWGCGVLADKGPYYFDAVTKRINGGLRGKAHRDAYYARALQMFGYRGTIPQALVPTTLKAS